MELARLKQQRTLTTTPMAPAQIQLTNAAAASPSNYTSDQPRRQPQHRFCFKCGIFGHVVSKCHNTANPNLVMQLDLEGEPCKLVRVIAMGQVADPITHDPLGGRLPVSLIGEANEVAGSIDGVPCFSIADTGSQITTVSEEFYIKHLSDL